MSDYYKTFHDMVMKEDHFLKDSFDAMMTDAFLKSKEQNDG